MFPWEYIGGWFWGYEEKSECVGLIVRAISLQDFQPMWSWAINVTDRQTDRRTTCNRNTALCTMVHRAVRSHYDCVITHRTLIQLVTIFN